jgi:ABC-type glycerol-3-phosphate transport system substrate-binding protein
MVFKDAPHQEQAKEFVKYLLSDENYLRFLKCTSGGTLPVFRDTGEDPYFQDDPNLRVLITQIKGGIRHGFRGPPDPVAGAIEGERIHGDALRMVLSGEKSPAEALAIARERTEKIVAQQRGVDR